LFYVLVVFLSGMASKRRSFGERFSGCPSLSSSFLLLDLYPSAGLFRTRASQWSSPSLYNPTAFSYGHVGLRWSGHDLHAPRFSFFVFARHRLLFLVLAGGGHGFRRSAVTGVAQARIFKRRLV